MNIAPSAFLSLLLNILNIFIFIIYVGAPEAQMKPRRSKWSPGGPNGAQET